MSTSGNNREKQFKLDRVDYKRLKKIQVAEYEEKIIGIHKTIWTLYKPSSSSGEQVASDVRIMNYYYYIRSDRNFNRGRINRMDRESRSYSYSTSDNDIRIRYYYVLAWGNGRNINI